MVYRIEVCDYFNNIVVSTQVMDLLSIWLASAPLATHTQRAYRTEVGRLVSFIERRNIPLDELEPRLLKRFWRDLVSGRMHRVDTTPSPGSLQQSRRIVSAFLRWSVTQGHASVELLAELDQWSIPESPEPSVTACARQTSISISHLIRARDLNAAAAALSFWTGATPGELASLKTAAIGGVESQVTIRRRQTLSTVMLPEELGADLKALASDGRAYFFGTHAPPSSASIAQRIARWSVEHNALMGSARRLRRRFLDLAKQAGWNSDEIRSQMRRPHLELNAAAPPTSERLASIKKVASNKSALNQVHR